MKSVQLMLVIAVSTLCGYAQSAGNTTSVKPLFVKAKCDGQLSTAVLNSLKQALIESKHYVIMSRLEEYGLNKTSAYISMICTERGGTVAVASVYGEAHCVATNQCHLGIVGSSLNVALCDGKADADCGGQLYQRFDEWMHSSAPIFVGDQQ